MHSTYGWLTTYGSSHNRACIDVIITEERDHSFFGFIGVNGGESLHDVPHVTSRSLLVIGLRSMGVIHQMLGDVRPELGSLASALHLLQHLVWVHVPAHNHSALLPVHLYRPHTYMCVPWISPVIFIRNTEMCQANVSTTGNFQESDKWMISFADLSMFCLKSPVFLPLMGQSYLALFLKSTNCFTTERYVLTSSSSINRKKISSSMVYSMVSRKEASLLKGKENLVAWERRRKRGRE